MLQIDTVVKHIELILFMMRTSVKCLTVLPDGSAQRVCNSFSPSSCHSGLLSEQPVYAMVGPAALAGAESLTLLLFSSSKMRVNILAIDAWSMVWKLSKEMALPVVGALSSSMEKEVTHGGGTALLCS